VDPPSPAPTVALVAWGDVIEDYLEPLGVSLDAFLTEMTGGWMFGYLTALHRAGAGTVLVCVSKQVSIPWSTVHAPTGTPVAVLPATRAFRVARRLLGRRAKRRTSLAAVVLGYLCQEYEAPRFDVCVAVGRATGRAVIGTYQGAYRTRGGRWGRLLEGPIRRRSVRLASGLIIASCLQRERFREAYPGVRTKLAPIPNPVDVPALVERGVARRSVGLPSHAPVVAWHGRVEMRRKGLDVLVDAWERLRRQRPDDPPMLLLMGSGSDDPVLRRRLEGHGEAVVWIDHFVHDRSLIRSVLASADVFAFASPHEGFAVAPIEAMAMAVPVVATDAPGIGDLLPEGERSGGIVVPVGDHVAMADAIARLLDDPEGRHAVGVAGRRRVEEAFSLDAVGRSLLSFLVPEA
jgi:glycosyltransferase involved in cell wall biosynthesis